MIIQTRYRDVPWSEIRPNLILTRTKLRKALWEASFRGKKIRIEVPPHMSAILAAKCKCGPHGYAFYLISKGAKRRISKATGRYMVVCPHIAEIGD